MALGAIGAVQLGFEQLHDFAVFGKSAQGCLRENDLAVDLDFEYTSGGYDQFR